MEGPRQRRSPTHRDPRRPGVCPAIPAPRPAAWPAGRALLRVLPSRRQSQARAHRLPHRAAPAHRRSSPHPREASPRRQLPVLWRADEKADTPAAPVESKPRTSVTDEAILHMTALRITILMTTCFLRNHGQGNRGLCPSPAKRRDSERSRTSTHDLTSAIRTGSTLKDTHYPHAPSSHPAQQLYRAGRPQTQNAPRKAKAPQCR